MCETDCCGRYAAIIELKTQSTFKVPLSAVHRFDEKKHSNVQAYKFDAQNGEILFGTISFIAGSEQELDEILASTRNRKPPNSLILSAAERTDNETDVEEKKNGKNFRGKRKVEESLQSRLTEMRNQQSLKRQNIMDSLEVGDTESGTALNAQGSAAESSSKKLSVISIEKLQVSLKGKHLPNTKSSKPPKFFVKVTPAKTPELIAHVATTKLPTTIKSRETLTVGQSASHSVSNITEKLSSNESACSSNSIDGYEPSQEVIHLSRSSEFKHNVLKRSVSDLRESEKKISNLTSALQLSKQELQDVQSEKESLVYELEVARTEILEMQGQLNAIKEELKNVRALNDEWQRSSLQKCDIIQAIVSEISTTYKDIGKDGGPNVPVGYMSYNGIHLGRGIWLSEDAYLLATHDVTLKTKKTFVRKILVAVFGYDLLAESTLTGRGSNRCKEKKQVFRSLDPKKILAIKDIYRYFLINGLNMEANEAEMEADRTNQLISKKIAQVKRIYEKPEKVSGKKLGVSKDDPPAESYEENDVEISEDENYNSLHDTGSFETAEINENENPLHSKHNSVMDLNLRPEGAKRGILVELDNVPQNDNLLGGAVKQALDIINRPSDYEYKATPQSGSIFD